MAQLNVDLSGSEPAEERSGWEAKPRGWYRMAIHPGDAELKPTKNGDGKCLHIKMSHLDLGHTSDYQMVFLTIEHPKAETVEIARAQLKSLAVAVEHPDANRIGDTREIEGKPFYAFLYPKKAPAGREEYADRHGMEQKVGSAFRSPDFQAAKEAEERQGADMGTGEPPPSDDVPF